MAKANADAIRGLQPKISVWNTGENANGADATAPLRNLMQSLPPLFETIGDQTGIRPPTWLAQMPQAMDNYAQPNGDYEPATTQKGKAITNAPTNGDL